MATFKKLLIVGDSFCADREFATDWPNYLASILNVELLGKGFGGCSWWSVKKYLNSLTDTQDTLLLICHTSSSRIPNDFDIPINIGTAEHAKRKYKDLYDLALKFYESDLYSKSFYKWAQDAWIKELNESTNFFNIVHVPCFDLFNVQLAQSKVVMLPNHPLNSLYGIVEKFGHPKIHRNHYSIEHNKALAASMADVLKDLTASSNGIHRFDVDNWV